MLTYSFLMVSVFQVCCSMHVYAELSIAGIICCRVRAALSWAGADHSLMRRGTKMRHDGQSGNEEGDWHVVHLWVEQGALGRKCTQPPRIRMEGWSLRVNVFHVMSRFALKSAARPFPAISTRPMRYPSSCSMSSKSVSVARQLVRSRSRLRKSSTHTSHRTLSPVLSMFLHLMYAARTAGSIVTGKVWQTIQFP